MKELFVLFIVATKEREVSAADKYGVSRKINWSSTSTAISTFPDLKSAFDKEDRLRHKSVWGKLFVIHFVRNIDINVFSSLKWNEVIFRIR